MANLLLKERKVTLLWGQRVRIATMIMVVSLVGFIIIAAALLPIALYSRVVLMSIQEGSSGANTSEGPGLGKQRQEIIRELQADKELLATIAQMDTLPEPSMLLRSVNSLMSTIGSVTTSLVTLENSPEGDTYTLRISGTALTRSDIVAVRDVFEESTLFNITSFPLSNLTPQVDGYIFLVELVVNNEDGESNKEKHES